MYFSDPFQPGRGQSRCPIKANNMYARGLRQIGILIVTEQR